MDFDYIIIGGGLSGLQLCYHIINEPKLSHLKIGLFEQNKKNTNDKTFCFWQKKEDKSWTKLISKTWNYTNIGHQSQLHKLDLLDYNYHKIESIDFYQYMYKLIEQSNQIKYINEKVIATKETSLGVEVKTDTNHYNCGYIFDSRVKNSLESIEEKSIYVNQNFLGFKVKFQQSVLKADTYTMMDFNCRWENSSSFMYILPQNTTEALFEFTLFTPYTLNKDEYKLKIKEYLNRNYPNIQYIINDIEYGEIPMTNFNFKANDTDKITHIGTAGGWVKASTGYSFKFAEKNCKKIVEQILTNQKPVGIVKKKKYHFYDRLFLKILKNENTVGPRIFNDMFKKVPLNKVFKFLDEETTLLEDVKIILKLPYLPFLKALVN